DRARVERKPVMIDFYTSWCYYCKVLDAKTYTNNDIIKLSGEMVSLKINAEREVTLARSYFIRAYPIIVFLSREGKEVRRLYGYQTPRALKSVMEKILNDTARLETLAAEYKKQPKDSETAYLYADELMAKGRFDEAKVVLGKIVRGKGSARKEDATLDLAISHFRLGEHKQAAGQLSKFLSQFGKSERTEEARLFLGLSLVASGQGEKGVEEFEGLRKMTSRKWIAEEASRQLTLAK
ncbi:MAG: thioredoxin fold domain-containing protein, partial [Candidatus Eiseniibacteriota bacterium]